MTTLEQFNEEVLSKIFENVEYDEAELGCEWGVEELKNFITQKLTAHKELILKMVREKAPDRATEINMARLSEKIALETVGEVEAWNLCRQKFLNNLDTI